MTGDTASLSVRQRAILAAIRDFARDRGYPPSMREIGEAVGLNSTSTVSRQLGILQRAGYVDWARGKQRAVTIREQAAPPVAAPLDREQLGRMVREIWVATAREHPDPKPSWLVPWHELGEWDKEVDRRIGASVAAHAAAVTALEMHQLCVKEQERAEAERDRFCEQARILGEQKAEWLCEPCKTIHPWRDGDRFTASCPRCGSPMTPTSVSVRALQAARAEIEGLKEALEHVRIALNDAGPYFRAEERERIAQLAAEHKAICVCYCGRTECGDERPGHPRKFADFIRGET